MSPPRTRQHVLVRIRMATAADAHGVLEIYAPIIEHTAISFETVVPSAGEISTRITDRQPTYPWLVAEEQSTVLGYAYGGPFGARPAYRWSVETSVYVAGTSRGKGIGAALYSALLAVLAAQGYRSAIGVIALPNAASVALHEAMGFRLAGVLRAVGWKVGAWHDVGWWQRPLMEIEDPPGHPVDLTALPPGVLDGALAARQQCP